MALKYYIIDTETSGLSSKYHEVTEISIIRADDRMQLTEFIKCDYPERASLDALRITGKTLADLSQGISKEEVVEKANNFFNEDSLTPDHRCIVGHNIISFDKKFLHWLWEAVGKEFPANLFLDTIALSKDFLKKADQSKLTITKTATGRVSTTLHACCDMTGVKKLSGIHASKADSRNTYLLWKKLVEDHGINYLPHIKTFPHKIKTDDLANIDDLDMSDVM